MAVTSASLPLCRAGPGGGCICGPGMAARTTLGIPTPREAVPAGCPDEGCVPPPPLDRR